MTEPGADERPKTSGPFPKLNFGWLRGGVSWKVLIVTLGALGAAVALFVVVGGVDISADAPDGPLATFGLHFVFKRSVGTASGRVTPPDDLSSPYRVHLGAQHFDMVCANCHGRPGFGQSVVALSMSPRPQYLPKVVGQFTDSELYVIVEHGVKYSAMPSWATNDRGDEVWSMVAFLRQLPKLDAATYRKMTALPATEAGSTGSDTNTSLRPGNTGRDEPPRDEFLYASPTSGFSDQTLHDNPVATCARCHGADGSGAVTGGEAPNLTIQDPAYLHAALESYVTGGRKSGFMQTIAAELSEAQITALSNHYAGLPAQPISAPPANAALVGRGETIAAEGLPGRAIPACATCHESQGAAVIGAPHIAGQSATYLTRQLRAMGRGGRGSSVMWNPMSAVAHDLSDQEISALAAYYSGLKPAKATTGAQLIPVAQKASPRIDLASAKQIFETQCLKCHVNGGRGDLQGNFPNLTLQTKTYVAQSLYAFHTGARLSDKMQQVTEGLSLDQMANLASYINNLPESPALAGKIDQNAALRGAVIATRGAADRGVPACLSCHGAKSIAALPLIPTLQGQNLGYLHKKLDAYTRPYPANSYALNPMPAIASKLTEKERADLAAYFAAAPLLPKAVMRQ